MAMTRTIPLTMSMTMSMTISMTMSMTMSMTKAKLMTMSKLMVNKNLPYQMVMTQSGRRLVKPNKEINLVQKLGCGCGCRRTSGLGGVTWPGPFPKGIKAWYTSK